MKQTPSALTQFTHQVATRTGLSFSAYSDFHRWCCDTPDQFWTQFLNFSELRYEGDPKPVLASDEFSDCHFFPNVSLNYARSLFEGAADSRPSDIAVIVANESGELARVNRQQLMQMSLSIAGYLASAGVVSGDRVVAIAKNSIESIAACLGAAAIGATWSSVSPELGSAGVIERFGQLTPKVLFADTEYTLNGVEHNLEPRLNDLLGAVTSIEQVVLLGSNDSLRIDTATVSPLSALLAGAALELENLQSFAFNHPLFVMFSSGTTGPPKCIVHGTGGTLLEHIKEHRLHSGLCRDDTLLFQTSTGWMMWNWQLSALASGTTIVLYDGSVSYPEKTALLQIISELDVTVFGTSPAYIQFLIESGISPAECYEYPALRSLQSTGSVLYEAQFEWITQAFKAIPVQSVSGGTDMIGCLVLGHPELPVITGDSQCLSLGIDVRVKTEDDIALSGEGELVVVKPFPSKPVFMWNDADGSIMHRSYFEKNPGIWTHGDQIRITADGSPRILGRSDGTLNIRGVRIGPAEIYTIVNQIDGVRESMAIEQASPREPGGSRLILLLVTQENTELDRSFILQLKKRLATEASRLHVPAVVARVSALPRTHNGKASEKAARDAVNRKSASNHMALVNPEVLTEIQQIVPLAPM